MYDIVVMYVAAKRRVQHRQLYIVITCACAPAPAPLGVHPLPFNPDLSTPMGREVAELQGTQE